METFASIISLFKDKIKDSFALILTGLISLLFYFLISKDPYLILPSVFISFGISSPIKTQFCRWKDISNSKRVVAGLHERELNILLLFMTQNMQIFGFENLECYFLNNSKKRLHKEIPDFTTRLINALSNKKVIYQQYIAISDRDKKYAINDDIWRVIKKKYPHHFDSYNVEEFNEYFRELFKP